MQINDIDLNMWTDERWPGLRGDDPGRRRGQSEDPKWMTNEKAMLTGQST